MAEQQQQQPVLRWPALSHPSAAQFLGLALPHAPTQSLGAPDGTEKFDGKAVEAAIGALASTDVSYL